MANRGCSTRSAERATFSALRQKLGRPLERLPIRLRLATSVAAVAFVILALFAVVVGQINAHRLRSDFYTEVQANATNLSAVHFHLVDCPKCAIAPPVSTVVPNVGAVIRLLSISGNVLAPRSGAPNLGSPLYLAANNEQSGATNVNGYRVVSFLVGLGFDGDQGYLQYAQPLSSVDSEIAGLQLILFLGALIGTALAFGAGSLVARRAIAPIAGLTAAAREIEQTRDPDSTLPQPVADDEVAELSRTLSGMLASLSEARDETEATLERQRAFVADASHELRTPLTSVLANLELLVDSLRGADRETADSALRSTKRMRRLVGDLLLLARTDAGQVPPREPLDLAEVVIDAASELESVSRDHVLELDVRPTPIVGNRDDLQRVATNLLENALRHTPPNTHITASTRSLADGSAELVVADDGPGIPADLRPNLFARFIRGAGDRGGSFGLGLAIVAAVTEAHGGSVQADDSPHGGARFTVHLPPATTPPPQPPADADEVPTAPSAGASRTQ
ncbi:MAG: HAMP domain-containing sensor histidine kinase [Solirubrobacteraceae bacterium]